MNEILNLVLDSTLITLHQLSSASLLQGFLCIILLVSALMVSISSNPVESVLFLVLTFLTGGILLMAFLSEFFGITVIIIYVGAIAVLFLFVIMMLNIKDYSVFFDSSDYFTNHFTQPIILFINACYILSLLSAFFIIKVGFLYTKPAYLVDAFSIDSLNNIEVLGQVLYNYYVECFLLAGFVLLVALITSIVLTLTFNHVKKGQQIPNRQLARSDKFLSFFN